MAKFVVVIASSDDSSYILHSYEENEQDAQKTADKIRIVHNGGPFIVKIWTYARYEEITANIDNHIQLRNCSMCAASGTIAKGWTYLEHCSVCKKYYYFCNRCKLFRKSCL